MITQDQLKAAGFQHRILNGIIDEWSISLFGRDDAPLDNCLVVRFNEHPSEPVKVYLITGRTMTRLRINELDRLMSLVEILREV